MRDLSKPTTSLKRSCSMVLYSALSDGCRVEKWLGSGVTTPSLKTGSSNNGRACVVFFEVLAMTAISSDLSIRAPGRRPRRGRNDTMPWSGRSNVLLIKAIQGECK